MNDSLSRLSSMIESAKELTIEAAVSASARLTDTASSQKPEEICKLLNSRIDREIMNGMKLVLSTIARGEDALPYFADVIKNITSTNHKIKEMVFIYLTKYADTEPDTALLSINSIQKTLNDKNPVNRANAIRSLAGIRIDSIIPILALSMKRTSTDPSSLVRAATAISIGKVFEMSGKSRKEMTDMLSKLLSDSESVVVCSAIKSLFKIELFLGETKKWELVHGKFRRFCSLIRNLDEWSQSYLLDILTEYSRKFLPEPENDQTIDPDLQLFLSSIKPLCQSTSEIVIMNAIKSTYLLAPFLFQEYKLDVVLTRIATIDTSFISLFALHTILFVSRDHKKFFSRYYKKFYVSPDDPNEIVASKLEVLSSLADSTNFKFIFEELKYYASSKNKILAQAAIKTVGECSQISTKWSQKILKWSLAKLKQSNSEILNELLTIIRYLIQQMNNNDSEKANVSKTTHNLLSILQDDRIDLKNNARASIIWITGEYAIAADSSIGPEILRRLVKNYSKEQDIVRYQILVLACKVFAFKLAELINEVQDENKSEIEGKLLSSVEYRLFKFTLQLAKYDTSYDTRDRARMFNILLNSGIERAQLASLFLQVPKPVPLVVSLADKTNDVTKSIEDFFKVDDWQPNDNLPSPSIRKETPIQVNRLANAAFSFVEDRSKSPSPVTEHSFSSKQFSNINGKDDMGTLKQQYKLQSLDEFFGSEQSESEEDEEDGDEDSDEDEDEEDEDEDEEEDEEIEEVGEDEEGIKSSSEIISN